LKIIRSRLSLRTHSTDISVLSNVQDRLHKLAMSSAPPTKIEHSNYWNADIKSFKTSARLHLQHFLVQNTLGYLLDQEIEKAVTTSSHLKIADLGCGNGIWLTELSSELSRKGISAQLDGYDINHLNFPHPAHLPQSVSLKKLDILRETLPSDLLGTYDIVHVQGFTSLVVNSNVTPLLSAVLAFLKPGGFLQWVEVPTDGIVVQSPSPTIAKTSCDQIIQYLKGISGSQGLIGDWVALLDQCMLTHGFNYVRMSVKEKRKQDLKAWTEDYLMVLEELTMFFPSREQEPGAPITREAWKELFSKAVSETLLGVVVHQEKIHVAIGRKPL
jgi:SAM-dependent methyltransferase